MQPSHAQQLAPQLGLQAIRQQSGPVFASLSGSDMDQPCLQVYILDPERHTFGDT